MQKHFHCHKVGDQLWVNSSSSVDPSEGHAAGMSFLLKALIFLMFCGPLIYHISVFWPMWHQLLSESTSNILVYKRQKSLLVVQPIISWKATKLYILCTTQFTKTANKSFFFFWMVWFWGISLSWSWPRPADTQEITMISLASYVSACPVQPVYNRSWTESTNLLTKTKKTTCDVIKSSL